MNDEEITLFFNEKKLLALDKALLREGSSAEQELQVLLDKLYEEKVPEEERKLLEAELQMERETEEARREAARRFALVHFHEGDDDFFFTSELRDSFYSVANLYRSRLREEIGSYTLDSLVSMNFSCYEEISPTIYAVLCDAMPNDQRITALMEFDFDRDTVSVFGRGDNGWKTYALKDVAYAMYKAERKEGLRLETRHEIFATALEGKELETSNEGVVEEKNEGPTMAL